VSEERAISRYILDKLVDRLSYSHDIVCVCSSVQAQKKKRLKGLGLSA
jgi:hypothetical protein